MAKKKVARRTKQVIHVNGRTVSVFVIRKIKRNRYGEYAVKQIEKVLKEKGPKPLRYRPLCCAEMNTDCANCFLRNRSLMQKALSQLL